MRCLHWVVVCVLFWAAFVLFRLGTATDIQPGGLALYLLGLPVAFGLPAIAGYMYAKYRFSKMVYSIHCEPKEGKGNE